MSKLVAIMSRSLDAPSASSTMAWPTCYFETHSGVPPNRKSGANPRRRPQEVVEAWDGYEA